MLVGQICWPDREENTKEEKFSKVQVEMLVTFNDTEFPLMLSTFP